MRLLERRATAVVLCIDSASRRSWLGTELTAYLNSLKNVMTLTRVFDTAGGFATEPCRAWSASLTHNMILEHAHLACHQISILLLVSI